MSQGCCRVVGPCLPLGTATWWNGMWRVWLHLPHASTGVGTGLYKKHQDTAPGGGRYSLRYQKAGASLGFPEPVMRPGLSGSQALGHPGTLVVVKEPRLGVGAWGHGLGTVSSLGYGGTGGRGECVCVGMGSLSGLSQQRHCP